MMVADALVRALETVTFRASPHEKDLQLAIAAVLDRAGEPYQREVWIRSDSRIDFYLKRARIGIEVKLAGSDADLLRQIQRYCACADIGSLVVATTRRRLAAAVPREVLGKPVHVALLEVGL